MKKLDVFYITNINIKYFMCTTCSIFTIKEILFSESTKFSDS